MLKMKLTEMREKQEHSTDPVRPVAKQTSPQTKAILESMKQIDRIFGREDQWKNIKTNNETHRSVQMKVSRLRSKLWAKNATSLIRNCIWQTGDSQNDRVVPTSWGCLAANSGNTHQPPQTR